MWGEIDFAAREWRIPAERMKAATEHRVPLSDAALDVLDEAKACHDGSDLVFPSPLQAGPPPVEHDAHENPARRRPGGAGHRPTDSEPASAPGRWSKPTPPGQSQRPHSPHTLGDSNQQAYIRGDAYTKRRNLMDQWAQYLQQP